MSIENEEYPAGAAIVSEVEKEPEGIERRRHLRVKPDVLSALLVIDGERHVVAIRDISTGGARLVNAPVGLRKDDRVELMARLEDEMVDVGCRIAYVQDSLLSPAVGVEFIDVDRKSTEKLLSFVCKLGMELVHG